MDYTDCERLINDQWQDEDLIRAQGWYYCRFLHWAIFSSFNDGVLVTNTMAICLDDDGSVITVPPTFLRFPQYDISKKVQPED